MSDQSDPSDIDPAPLPRPLPPFEPSEVAEEPAAAAEPERVNRKAIWSFVIGLLLFIPVVAVGLLGIIAITSGIHARREIVASKGYESGDRLALAGIVLGSLSLIKVVVITYVTY
ncbi:MAG: DUF4190 domain-containing protein [Aeromicrobium sp.]